MRILWMFCLCAALGAAPPEAAVPGAASPEVAVPGAVLPEGAAPAEERVPLTPLEQLQVDAIRFAESQAASRSGHYTFRVVKPPVLPRVPAGGKLSFEPEHLSRKELGGMFFATFRQKLDGRLLGLIRVDLEGKWTGRLLRVKAPMPRKTVPEPAQFEQMDFEGNPPVGAISELPKGYRLRAPVSSGHILVMQDLETIPVVAAGEQVRLEVVSGNLVIAVDALARSSGAVGDKVRLEMPSSHKNVQAVVTGPDEARVQWANGN
ncbi:MAG: flagellar basal body P-ring formation chaperone FlgA [Holophaga sp.]|nr:flagellar basal body P-ring formation chaperone FlgA [Holophaga sp.]